MKLPAGPTKYVVLGLATLAGIALAYSLGGPLVGTLLSVILIYEGWTLRNKYESDTISEVLWALAERPLVPWVAGLATAWAIESGVLVDPWAVLVVGFLQGHFWFQRSKT